MLRTVLLPTDLGACQELVMRFVSGLPALGVRRVVCCHVVDATGLEGPVIAAKVKSARAHMERLTAPLVDAGLELELSVLTGDPEKELLQVAADKLVDGIVCGTSGKTTADRLFVGSVSERLARDSGIPSLTVRYDLLHTMPDPADRARRFGRMLLVPTDFSGTAARALNLALSLPREAVSTVRVLNVIDHGPNDEAEADRQLRTLVEIAKERGVQAVPIIGHGAPERAILQEIEASGITGVVVGSRGRSVLQEALLGSVSMTLLRQATCPVLIVP
jgi:nucleotide-binding universal stress UspA family protein